MAASRACLDAHIDPKTGLGPIWTDHVNAEIDLHGEFVVDGFRRDGVPYNLRWYRAADGALSYEMIFDPSRPVEKPAARMRR